MEGQGRDQLPFHISSFSAAPGSFSQLGRQTLTSEETPRSSDQKFYHTDEVALSGFLSRDRRGWNRKPSSNPSLVLLSLVTQGK